MDLSIIIPAYNEADRLPKTLESIAEFFATRNDMGVKLHEVIVVDDGSTDGTSESAKEFGNSLPVHTIRLPNNQGKGAALKAGMLAAAGECFLLDDADGATPIAEVINLFQALIENDAQIAIGSRIAALTPIVSTSRKSPVTSNLVSMPWYRRVIGRVYHALCLPLHPGIRDAACGFKLFRAEAARIIFERLSTDRFAFDVESLFLAHRFGYKVVEVPVEWTAVSESKVRLLRDGIEMFVAVMKLYIRKMVGR